MCLSYRHILLGKGERFCRHKCHSLVRPCLLKRYITTRKVQEFMHGRETKVLVIPDVSAAHSPSILRIFFCCIILRNPKYINTVRDNIFILRSVRKWSKESDSSQDELSHNLLRVQHLGCCRPSVYLLSKCKGALITSSGSVLGARDVAVSKIGSYPSTVC